MGNFKRGDGFSSKKRHDGGGDFKKGGQSDRPNMHRATCSECGQACEVPFRPTGDKPVFCSVCFSNKDTSNKSRSMRRTTGRTNFGDKPMFKAICVKCHKECEVPFRPSADKSVFCNNCFRKTEGRGGGSKPASPDQYRKQFEILNHKLDNILEMLSSKPLTKKTSKEEKPAAGAAKKAVEKKKAVKKVASKKKAPTPKKADKKTVVKKKKVEKKTVVKKKK